MRRFLARQRGRARQYDSTEVTQAAMIGLWGACFYWDPARAHFTFGAWTTIYVRKALLNHWP